MSLPATYDEIKLVSREANRALAALGLSTYLFGGTACRLYGNTRVPNDVDIVVNTTLYSTEELKVLIRDSNPTMFYLRPSQKIGETYKILWAHLPGRRRSCKVDVLVPGILNIPRVPAHLIHRVGNHPIMPIIPLLLLKLQGWEDHRLSPRSDMNQKQYVDIRDINQLLRIAVSRGARLQDDLAWLPAEFVDAGRQRLVRYLNKLRPANAEAWAQLGFEVGEEYLL